MAKVEKGSSGQCSPLEAAIKAATTRPPRPQVTPIVIKLAVREMPGSGTPEELRAAAGIDAEHIVQAVKSLL